MRIYEWSERLGMDSKKSRGPEDFWTICPCHSDQNPSLHVYIGRKTGEIVMKCFVCGAKGKEVCETLGLPIGEVMCDARTGEKSDLAPRPSTPRSGKSGKSCRPLKIGDRWQDDYTVTAVYEYQRPDGTVALRKYRAEEYGEDGRRTGKTFTIQHQGTDGKWHWGAGIYAGLLYHLPDVIEGTKKGGTILIAEGEKDVDNLRKLGYTATCGMHGGGTDQLTGKWNDEHAKHFDGAGEVIVIADNDAAGEGIAQWICKSLKERVKSLKLLRIHDHYPDLPAHGDFTDWIEQLKAAGVNSKSDVFARLSDMFGKTAEWQPGKILKFDKGKDDGNGGNGDGGDGSGGGDDEEYPPYHGSRMYCIKNGCLAVRSGQAGAKVLCDFLPEPKEIIHRDDGSTKRTDYVISATTAGGKQLPDAVIEGSAAFQSMKWLMDAWDHYGNCKVVKNAEQMVRDAINTAGQRISLHRDVYEHTGIRIIDGKPCYLYNGGAIGADNVSVEMTGVLKRYNLDDCGYSRQEAAEAELYLLSALPGRIVYPQLAQCYLAPLYSVMEDMQQPPSYVVMVIGGSNAGKSTVASYCLAHFGSFYNRQFPATFEGTVNGERDKLFWLKDCLLVVDDYRKGDGNSRNPHDLMANTLISAVADRSDRTRLDEKKKQSAPRPCRAVCIMTAEELPRLSTSRQLRVYRIDVELGDIYKEDARELEPLRLMAKGGYFRQCMRYYIEDLLARWDTIESEMDDRIEDASSRMHKLITRKEGRLLDCATHLMVGVGLMLDHLQRCGVMTEEEKQQRLQEAAQGIAANIEEQGRYADDSKPEETWLQTLRSLLATRSVYLMDKEELMRTGFRAGVIGFEEDGIVNLDPHACDEYIGERLRKGGSSLNAGRPAILRALAKAGKIRYRPKADGSGVAEYTFPTRIGRTRPRMIQMYRWALDGDDPPTPKEMGFTPIEGEQEKLPFDK